MVNSGRNKKRLLSDYLLKRASKSKESAQKATKTLTVQGKNNQRSFPIDL